MIRGIYVVSSDPQGPSDYESTLDRIGNTCGWGPVGSSRRLIVDDSNLWVHLIPLVESGYEKAEQDAIEQLLGGPVRHILQIEFDDGSRSKQLVVSLVTQLRKEWPIVFDNCLDTLYGPNQIDQVTEEAEF